MTVKQITSDTADEQIKQLYEKAFPEDEQIPWKDLMRLVEKMPLDFSAYYDGEDLISQHTTMAKTSSASPSSIHVSLSTGSGTLPCAKS